jgi:hypothetical protein
MTRSLCYDGDSPVELRNDPFLSAHIFQHGPEWLFREAERRWNEGDHPWRFLIGVKKLPPACYDFFRAAESVSSAMELIEHCLYGGATLPRRLLVNEMQDLARAGNATGANRVAAKIVRGLVKFDLWKDAGQTHPQLEAWKSEAEADLRKRYGRKLKPASLPTTRQFNEEAECMIGGWLRLGNRGTPGFCFFTERAMIDLLALIRGVSEKRRLHWTDMRLRALRKLRQRLGLMHAYYRKPIVTHVTRVGPRAAELTHRNDSGPPFRLRFDF